MLCLRAVDVHGVRVCDRDHEHGCIARLAVVVLVLIAVAGGGFAAGGTGDGLEVGEDCILLGLAGRVGVGGYNAVVLRDESASYCVMVL
jgi:hypothetical protein